MNESNKRLVRRWVEEIFNAGTVEIAEQIVAVEFTEHAWAPFGQTAPGPVNGPQHARATREFLRAQFPDLHMTIEAILAEDDLVCTRIAATGTNLGALNALLPATGRTFTARQAHWFRVTDGRLVEHWAIRDDLTAMLQLGVIARPGPPPHAAGTPASHSAQPAAS